MRIAITPLRIFGFVAMLIVWLNLTNFYLFISGVTKIPFRYVGILFIMILGGYIAINLRVVTVFLRRIPISLFLALFIVLPILSVLIAPVFSMSHIGYVLLCGLMFLSSMIWIHHEGWERFSRIILIAWAVGVAGVLLSYFMPAFFQGIAMMQQAAMMEGPGWGALRVAEASEGRAFGFYMQANRACLALAVLLTILLPVYYHDKPLRRMLVLGVTLFAVMLTGSRGGFVFMVLICGVLFLSEMLNGVRNHGRVKSGFYLLPRYMLLVVLAVVALVAALMVESEVNRSGQSAGDRILSSFFGSETRIETDLSVQSRLSAQSVYIQKILQSPVYGHGLGAGMYEVAMGTLLKSSHNNYLETMYLYGIPVGLAIYALIIYLPFCRNAKIMQRYFRYNQALLLVTLILVASLVSNSVFDYRIFPVAMAFTLSMLYFPSSSHMPAAQALRMRRPR